MSDKRESSDEDNAKTNLIVNYLPQSMTDENFRVLFAKYGDIRSARIIRKPCGYSYGFGFVDYFNAEDAERAIESLNGSTLSHKKIKVSKARPSTEKIKNANLYVSNLPPNYNETDIVNLFAKHGEIIQCRLLGTRVGTAFVLFNLREQALDAMKVYNGYLIPGTTHRISIKLASNEPFKKQLTKTYRGAYNDNGFSYSSKDPKSPFSGRNGHYGNDGDSYHYNNNGKYHPGPSHKFENGPIRNTSHNSRFNPLSSPSHFYPHSPSDMYSDMPMATSQPYVKMNEYYQPSYPSNHGHMDNDSEHILFVYNIGDASELDLEQLFLPYGRLLRVNVMRHGDSGESRGYCFVTMKHYGEALNAINALNGFPYSNNKPLQVSFKKV